MEEQQLKELEVIQKHSAQRQPRFPADIPMETWESHICRTIAKDTRPIGEVKDKVHPCKLFTEAEVYDAIRTSKDRRLPGIDGICNEHLKVSEPYLNKVWTALLNKCLKVGIVPDRWRKAPL